MGGPSGIGPDSWSKTDTLSPHIRLIVGEDGASLPTMSGCPCGLYICVQGELGEHEVIQDYCMFTKEQKRNKLQNIGFKKPLGKPHNCIKMARVLAACSGERRYVLNSLLVLLVTALSLLCLWTCF